MSVYGSTPLHVHFPFKGLRHLLQVREDLGRSAVSGVNIEPGQVSQCVFYSFVAQDLLHFSKGTALSHVLAGVILEDKDLASLVLVLYPCTWTAVCRGEESTPSPESDGCVLWWYAVWRRRLASAGGSGAPGRFWLDAESVCPRAVWVIIWRRIQWVYLTPHPLVSPQCWCCASENGPPGQAPWYEAEHSAFSFKRYHADFKVASSLLLVSHTCLQFGLRCCKWLKLGLKGIETLIYAAQNWLWLCTAPYTYRKFYLEACLTWWENR